MKLNRIQQGLLSAGIAAMTAYLGASGAMNTVPSPVVPTNIAPTKAPEDTPSPYGNKYKNLVRLRDIVKGMPQVEIPEFIGIETSRVEAYLRRNDASIFTDYATVVQVLMNNQATVYLYGRPYTVEQFLQRIQQKIQSVFAAKRFPFTPDEKNLFNATAAQQQFFMVRSTGVEDSQHMANAGANVSVAYVEPALDPLEFAMADVVASYFGMQSLKNRVASGEVLSATDLCLPVLIQVLIGELFDGSSDTKKIPVSGVAYSTNQTISSPNFPITEINASYGHGEGVVANRVTADRYYITPSRTQAGGIQLYPMLYHKPHRLVPHRDTGRQQKHSLISCKNNVELACKSALSEEQIKNLYTVLKKIEADYGQPMDVEFVVLDTTIYIVQARPAMRHAMAPSYCALEKLDEADTADLIAGLTLVPGKAELLVITNPADIIVTNTLDEADQMATSVSCKAVLVGAWASSLSHAAVNFISHGTPCMYVQDIAQVKALLSQISPRQPLVIDAQRRMLFLWKNNKKSIQTVTAQGWFEHPIDATLSLSNIALSVLPVSANPMPQDAKLATLFDNFKLAVTEQKQKEILTAITERIQQTFILTERRMKHADAVCDNTFKQAFTAFKATYGMVIAELTKAIESHADHFEILFYHKMLQALLYQTSDTQAVLGGYNYGYFLNNLFANQALLMLVKRHGNKLQFVQEISLAQHCPTPALAQQWRDFLLTLQNNPAAAITNVATMQKMVADFDRLGCLPLWFATEFYQAQRAHTGKDIAATQALLASLVEDYNPATVAFLQKLEHYKTAMTSIAAQRGTAFAHIAAAKQVWQEVQRELIQPLTSSQFSDDFAQMPLVAKIMALDVMYACIDTLDATIKTLKTSGAISWSDRIMQFKVMLADFNTIFRAWVTDIMPERALRYHGSWNLSAYLRQKQNLFDQIMAQFQPSMFSFGSNSNFQRSAGFSVNAATLGSGTAFERHYPVTAEDIFMLIHQNSLMAVAGTYASLFHGRPLDEQLYLPAMVKELITYFESSSCIATLNNASMGTPRRIGIQYTAEAITILYNVPLQNHSATFQIVYDRTTQQCSLAVQFLGEARTRWEQVAVLAGISKISQFDLATDVQLDITAGIVSWAWTVKQMSDLPLMMDYLALMSRISFGDNLYLGLLRNLHRGATPFKQAINMALAAYIAQYGRGACANDLERELRYI